MVLSIFSTAVHGKKKGGDMVTFNIKSQACLDISVPSRKALTSQKSSKAETTGNETFSTSAMRRMKMVYNR